jgi:hypothetical protein
MAPPTINRIHLTDDTGQGEDGTIIDDALFQTLQDNIDGLSGAIETDFQTADAAITTAYKAADAGLAAANASVLLKANASSLVGTGAFQNIDSCAISGLTVFDVLEVFWSLQNTSSTVAIAQPMRLATDADVLVSLLPSLAAATYGAGRAIVKAGPAGNSTVGNSVSEGLLVTGARVDQFGWVGLTIPWNGAWHLNLQSALIPSGVTVFWSWNIYKRKGQ